MTVNFNGEAETVKVTLKPKPKLKKLVDEYDFSQLDIKGRGARGNVVARKNAIARITLKSKGVSTIGGKDLWFDGDIQRINDEERGQYLGQFGDGDHILAIFKDGTYYTTNLDLSNKYQGELLKIEKLDTTKVYSAMYYDANAATFYIKRFVFDISDNNPLPFIPDAKGNYLVAISDDKYPQMEVVFDGRHAGREPEKIDVEAFIATKGIAAKGKKCSSLEIKSVSFIEPLVKEEVSTDTGTTETDTDTTETDTDTEVSTAGGGETAALATDGEKTNIAVGSATDDSDESDDAGPYGSDDEPTLF